jgi:glycerophosphoryl diester phosphodiesterase
VRLPLITAHRGASAEAPENTLAALRLGFAQGADAGECDVRLTRDGEAVLMHDAGTRRTADRALIVAEADLAELRALDVGRWKGATWAGERVPTLAEALALVPPGRRLLIELKSGAEILPAVARALDAAARPAADFVLMSFDLAVAGVAKRCFPEIEVHGIVERDGSSAADLAARARAAGLDGLNLDRRFPLDRDFVRELHAAGLRVHVWTVDEAKRAWELAAAGVDSLTTNRPGWLRARLHEAGGGAG